MKKKIVAFTMVGALSVGAIGAAASSLGYYKGTGVSKYVLPALTSLVEKVDTYESNENYLLDKIEGLKFAASDKINHANDVIAERNADIKNLEEQKAIIEGQVAKLTKDLEAVNAELNSNEAELANTKGELQTTKQALAEKINALNNKIAELDTTTALLKTANADKEVLKGEKAKLQSELDKANAEYDKIVPAAVETAKHLDKQKPADVSKVDTTIPNVEESSNKGNQGNHGNNGNHGNQGNNGNKGNQNQQ